MILDHPDQIKAFGLLQVYHMLKMEVKSPQGPKWRARPATMARNILTQAGRPDPGRLKKNVLKAYEAYLIELGVVKSS